MRNQDRPSLKHPANMNNTELEEKLFSDHRIRDIVRGVYASEAIPIHVKKCRLLHIVNTDPSYMPGKHWVVIYIGEDGFVENFDPWGKRLIQLLNITYGGSVPRDI